MFNYMLYLVLLKEYLYSIFIYLFNMKPWSWCWCVFLNIFSIYIHGLCQVILVVCLVVYIVLQSICLLRCYIYKFLLFSFIFQSPPKGATIPYRPKPQVNGPVILANGQAYTIQGNFAVPAQEVNI